MQPSDERARVMIVDDTPVNIEILAGILENQYDISFATSGSDALEMISSIGPDLILLDVMMPVMNGYDLCRHLKADPIAREIPVIFITALAQQENEVTGLQAGAVDYITKPFNPEVVRLRIRNQLELKMYRDMYARLSLVDGLTGIPNRRAFDEYLQREWFRLQRLEGVLTILMLDIDYFKLYNDSYGHLQGDECLRKVALAITASLRASDFAARYGGEEFVCILHEADGDGALITAERIRSTVQTLNIEHEASKASPVVTVSIGIAAMIPSADTDPMYLMGLADQMLYSAKASGRNRVAAP